MADRVAPAIARASGGPGFAGCRAHPLFGGYWDSEEPMALAIHMHNAEYHPRAYRRYLRRQSLLAELQAAVQERGINRVDPDEDVWKDALAFPIDEMRVVARAKEL